MNLWSYITILHRRLSNLGNILPNLDPKINDGPEVFEEEIEILKVQGTSLEYNVPLLRISITFQFYKRTKM